MNQPQQRSKPFLRRLSSLAIGLGIIGLGWAGHTIAQSNSDEILVWTDATRLPGFQAYQKSHPEVKLRIVTVDLADLPAKIQLFNRSGSGWPDVVFTPSTGQIGQLLAPGVDYLADVTTVVAKATLQKFAKGAMAPCTQGTKVYCLRNDLAQGVLYYNAKLMKDFGYTVPKTWEEYRALGLQVAKEHPGYVIGAAGGGGDQFLYFWPGRCEVSQVLTAKTVRINFGSSNCTRVGNMLDDLIAAGAVSKSSLFDPEFAKLGTDNKILMTPGPSWLGEYIVKPLYKTPTGQMAAAMPLRWSGETTAWTGGYGGGIYLVSKRAKNVKAAADVALWMSTAPEYQTDAPTFPAYLPAADLWGAKVKADKYFANDVFSVFRASAGLIDPKYGFPNYDTQGTFTNVSDAGLKAGKTYAQILPELQTRFTQVAQAAGYRVIK